MTSIDYSGASDYQLIRIRALEAVEASQVAEATKIYETEEVSKVWKVIVEDITVIPVLEFNNLWTNITLF